MPDGVITEELPAGLAQYRPVGLTADLVWSGVVFPLIGGLQKYEGPDRAALVFQQDRTVQLLLVAGAALKCG